MPICAMLTQTENMSMVHIQVAEAGSVSVETFMEVERYSHVMHISSTVQGRLQPHLTSWDALRAALPVGTVSGAPKVAHASFTCMTCSLKLLLCQSCTSMRMLPCQTRIRDRMSSTQMHHAPFVGFHCLERNSCGLQQQNACRPMLPSASLRQGQLQ